jgi:hypothetical protein
MARVWQSLRRILSALVIAYAVLCVGAFIFQRRLLYFPTKIPVGAVVAAGREHGFIPWENAAGQIIGWQIPAVGTLTGSVLVVHGNAGCAIGRDYLAEPIHEAGSLAVFVLEYPGYGARQGAPSRASLFAAAEEAFQYLPTGSPKYIVSESIGTGVACELARRHPAEIAGLALFVPYHDLASVAQRQMPFLPAYCLLLDRFNPAAGLQAYHGPVKFVVAGEDEILGPATGLRLFDGYAGPKDCQVIAGAHHNDVAEQAPDWWRNVLAFWRQHAKS